MSIRIAQFRLYQHIFRHLPGGVTEFVALSPERFYEFSDPQMHENAFFKELPVLTWDSGILKIQPKPAWYNDYITQLVDESLTWAGETFMVKNMSAFVYPLPPNGIWENIIQKNRLYEHYYCSHYYDKRYCNEHNLECVEPPDWEKRRINPCLYLTVQASKIPVQDKEDTLPLNNELKYVGFVLYLPDAQLLPDIARKYLLAGSLVSHLLSYVQAQFTTFLAVTALESPFPKEFKEMFDGIDGALFASAYNKLFPDAENDRFRKQHTISDITFVNTMSNYTSLSEQERTVIKRYITNIDSQSDINEFFSNNFGSKRLKAVMARGKNTVFLFDLYLYILKKFKPETYYNNKLVELRDLEATILTEENALKCCCDFAFWYIADVIETLLGQNSLEQSFIQENMFLLITDSQKFPDIFFRSHEKLLGSFANYVNKLTETHRKLFHCEHYALCASLPFNYSELKNKLDTLNQTIPAPNTNQPRMLHLFLSFNDTKRNALFLQNYYDMEDIILL